MFKIAKGIMNQQQSSDGSSCYTIGCDCGSSDHYFKFIIEYDKELGMIMFNGYQDLSWNDGYGNIFQRIIGKIKAITNILFKGYIELSSSTIISGSDKVFNIIIALLDSLKQIDEYHYKKEGSHISSNSDILKVNHLLSLFYSLYIYPMCYTSSFPKSGSVLNENTKPPTKLSDVTVKKKENFSNKVKNIINEFLYFLGIIHE